jgi:HAD superfamily phosphatase
MANLFVFDCDGVLRDESQSYLRCVTETVAHFSGGNPPTQSELTITLEESNDDWERTHRILQRRGRVVPFETVKGHFQDLYLGKARDFSGYINNEQWLAYNSLLGILSARHPLAIVSGAPRDEITYALRKNGADKFFSGIWSSMEQQDCANKRDGIEQAIARFKPNETIFCDDRPSPIREATQLPQVKVFGIMPPLAADGWDTVLREAGALDVYPNVKSYCRFLVAHLS